jgi:hypothetical protein
MNRETNRPDADRLPVPGVIAPHIPADVYRLAETGNAAVLPSAVIPAVPGAVPPAGAVRVWTPDGREIWLDAAGMAMELTHTAAVSAAPIPRWARTAALLMPTGAGSVALAAWGITEAAPGLLALAHALWSLCLSLLGLAVLLGVVLLLRPSRSSGVSATATATATAAGGLFRRATATATATATANARRR